MRRAVMRKLVVSSRRRTSKRGGREGGTREYLMVHERECQPTTRSCYE